MFYYIIFSAGVGRSGTFIVIEAQIERINRKQNVNVYGYLKNIRSQRNYLVQQEVSFIIFNFVVQFKMIFCGCDFIPVNFFFIASSSELKSLAILRLCC